MSLAFCTWKRESMEHQKSMSQLLGDRAWDEYEMPIQREILETKIAVLFFGKTLDKDYKVSLTNEEQILVAMLRQKCEKHSSFTNKVRLAFIFVSVYIDYHSHILVPLIRVMAYEERHASNDKFIDLLGRVYSGWRDYRDNHTWKACWLCVPSHGYYDCNENNIVLWNHSERHSLRNQVENVAKIASKTCAVAGIVMTSVPIGSLLATVVGVVAVGLILLDISRLINRLNHDQTINITDERAIYLWLNLLGNICSVGSWVLGELVTWSIVEGVTIPITVGIVMGGLKLTGSGIKGTKLIISFLDLSKKTTAKKFCMFITDAFLFYHCVTKINGQTIAVSLYIIIPIYARLIRNMVKYSSSRLCIDFNAYKESIRKTSEIRLIE